MITLLDIAKYKGTTIQEIALLFNRVYGKNIPCSSRSSIPEKWAEAIAPGILAKLARDKAALKMPKKETKIKKRQVVKHFFEVSNAPLFNSDNDHIATFDSYKDGQVLLKQIGGGIITIAIDKSAVVLRNFGHNTIIEYGIKDSNIINRNYYIKRCLPIKEWQIAKLKEVGYNKVIKGKVLDTQIDYFNVDIFGLKAFLYNNKIPENTRLGYGDIIDVTITKIDTNYDKLHIWVSMLSANYQKKKKREQEQTKKRYEYNKLKVGETVNAVIEKVEGSYVIVKFGLLSGIIPRDQLYHTRVHRIDQYLYKGKEIKTKILSKEYNSDRYDIKLSRKACIPNIWDTLDIVEGDLIEEAMFAGISDKGVFLSIAEGIEGFLPIGDISRRELIYLRDWETDSDQGIDVYIKEFNRNERSLYLTRKPIYDSHWEDIDNKFQIKHYYPVTILDMDEDNIWAELEKNLDVIIPKEELCWQNTGYIDTIYNIGQKMNVYLTKIDTHNRRIYGSVRKLIPNPWEIASLTIANKSIIDVKLVNTNDKFLTVESNDSNRLRGRIRLSELSWSELDFDSTEKSVKIGDIFKAKIVNWKPERFCMELSIRQIEEDPWKYVVVGNEVQGKIEKILNDYMIVELPNGLKCYSIDKPLTAHLGDTISFKVIESNRYKNRIIVSHQRLKQVLALDEVVRNFFSK